MLGHPSIPHYQDSPPGDNVMGAGDQQETRGGRPWDPQRHHAEHLATDEDTVRTASRHAEAGRNDRTLSLTTAGSNKLVSPITSETPVSSCQRKVRDSGETAGVKP